MNGLEGGYSETEQYVDERNENQYQDEYDNGQGPEEDEGVAMMQEVDQMGDGDTFSNVAQGLTGHHRDLMMQYWQDTINSIEHDDHKFKIHQLPLARIKKVMKADEDVKMISAEAPILFAKGCDIFITELTMRAWIHAEENKRRTLQRSDIASALQKSDMFDFLIDIVPREEANGKGRAASHIPGHPGGPAAAAYSQEYMDPEHESQMGEHHHHEPENSVGVEYQHQQQQQPLPHQQQPGGPQQPPPPPSAQQQQHSQQPPQHHQQIPVLNHPQNHMEQTMPIQQVPGQAGEGPAGEANGEYGGVYQGWY